jgi:hypothetical protein
MRRVTAVCAAAGIAASALAFVSPAQAAFHLIRWQGTGFCQIWDESFPLKPWPSDYKQVSKRVPTFVAAMAVKDGMLKRGVCKL